MSLSNRRGRFALYTSVFISGTLSGIVTEDFLHPYLPDFIAGEPKKIVHLIDINGDGVSDSIEKRGNIIPSFIVYLSDVKDNRVTFNRSPEVYFFSLPSSE
ncbi:hypothetical protein HYT25_01625 [Candidatus Pacearchaeota archaeon]|nr:hypothetical protein [Candidatus Pacearchaeota archaeon]